VPTYDVKTFFIFVFTCSLKAGIATVLILFLHGMLKHGSMTSIHERNAEILFNQIHFYTFLKILTF